MTRLTLCSRFGSAQSVPAPRARIAPVTALFLLMSAISAHAQSSVAILEVSVASTGGEPLAGAAVSLPGTGRTGWTDAQGSLRLTSLPPGVRVVEVRSLGYRPERFQVELREGYVDQWDVVLQPEPLSLAEVRVEAKRESRAGQMDFLRGFYERRERGVGYFLTRGEIEGHGSRDLSNLLRSVPGLRTTPSQFGQSRVTTRSSPSMGRSCKIRVYVDGMVYRAADDFVGIPTLDIEGIEVYRGRSELPAEFADPDADCGVVAIWTRRHGPNSR